MLIYSVLFIVTLVTFSMALHRARLAERQNTNQNPFTDVNNEINQYK